MEISCIPAFPVTSYRTHLRPLFAFHGSAALQKKRNHKCTIDSEKVNDSGLPGTQKITSKKYLIGLRGLPSRSIHVSSVHVVTRRK
jgi:hypothetical protein